MSPVMVFRRLIRQRSTYSSSFTSSSANFTFGKLMSNFTVQSSPIEYKSMHLNSFCCKGILIEKEIRQRLNIMIDACVFIQMLYGKSKELYIHMINFKPIQFIYNKNKMGSQCSYCKKMANQDQRQYEIRQKDRDSRGGFEATSCRGSLKKQCSQTGSNQQYQNTIYSSEWETLGETYNQQCQKQLFKNSKYGQNYNPSDPFKRRGKIYIYNNSSDPTKARQ